MYYYCSICIGMFFWCINYASKSFTYFTGEIEGEREGVAEKKRKRRTRNGES